MMAPRPERNGFLWLHMLRTERSSQARFADACGVPRGRSFGRGVDDREFADGMLPAGPEGGCLAERTGVLGRICEELVLLLGVKEKGMEARNRSK